MYNLGPYSQQTLHIPHYLLSFVAPSFMFIEATLYLKT